MQNERFAMRVLLPLAASAVLGCSDLSGTDPGAGPEFAVPAPPSTTISRLTPPADLNRDKVALGKALFNDSRLSGDGTISCASCHDLANGGADGHRVAVGIGGRVGQLNTPSVLNSGLNFAQFWDGRAESLEQQIDETVQNPAEMAGVWADVAGRLRADDELTARFQALYRSKPEAELVIDAIAEYVRALVTVDSPFDRYLAGDEEALGADAVEGYALFTKLGCVSCHQGRGVGGNFFQRIGVMDDYFADRPDPTPADLGRFNVTGREEDRYKFKVPSLRNVGQTAPYFHDGSAQTLDEAVRTMARYQLGRPIEDEQVALIVAFLESLTGRLDETLL